MPRSGSARMSAVAVATAFGGPEVLSVIDEPAPEPGPGDVRLDVRASGVNPIDCRRYSDAAGADPDSLPQRVRSRPPGWCRRWARARSDRPVRSRWATR